MHYFTFYLLVFYILLLFIIFSNLFFASFMFSLNFKLKNQSWTLKLLHYVIKTVILNYDITLNSQL